MMSVGGGGELSAGTNSGGARGLARPRRRGYPDHGANPTRWDVGGGSNGIRGAEECSLASPVGRATHEAPAPERVAAPEHHRFSWRVKRVGLVCAMMLASGNAWIGSPLAALWVGSRVQGSGPPAMSAIGVVAVVMGALSFTIIRLLNMLSVAYDRLLGLPARRRRQSPWMRSLRGEREDFSRPRARSPVRDRGDRGRHGDHRGHRVRDLVLLLLDLANRPTLRPLNPQSAPRRRAGAAARCTARWVRRSRRLPGSASVVERSGSLRSEPLACLPSLTFPGPPVAPLYSQVLVGFVCERAEDLGSLARMAPPERHREDE